MISAVGHETDTTLIDHAADRRAPTPTAAAEMAVPVRLELLAGLDGQVARLSRCAAETIRRRDQRLRDLARALPRLESLVAGPSQRFDLWSGRLSGALGQSVAARRARLEPLGAHLRPRLLADLVARQKDRLGDRTRSLETCLGRRAERARDRFDALSARLAPAFARLIAETERATRRDAATLGTLAARLDAAPEARLARLSDRLEALDRLRQTLGYRETLKRGYAVVRADGAVLTTKAEAGAAAMLEIEFQDGRLSVGRGKTRKPKEEPPAQGSLL